MRLALDIETGAASLLKHSARSPERSGLMTRAIRRHIASICVFALVLQLGL
jgi:hypothetical protein